MFEIVQNMFFDYNIIQLQVNKENNNLKTQINSNYVIQMVITMKFRDTM